ncbi:MAG TPA: GNAT family N-acetyltransferase [Casimicrobiaceae bacterium]|nr:GNAT family N-acetyltransferase [Casimicrobiaceae bacterium]
MSRQAAEIALRTAREGDLAAVAAIYALHVRTGTASFEVQAPDESEMARRWRDVVEQGWPYLVAVSAARVVGYAYAGAYRPRPAYRFTVEDSVYVEKEARGRGIGRALLGALIEASETAGARQMIAVIGDSTNAASIRLHASLGFRQVGLLQSVGRKFERWLDVVLMQRALGPGDRANAE